MGDRGASSSLFRTFFRELVMAEKLNKSTEDTSNRLTWYGCNNCVHDSLLFVTATRCFRSKPQIPLHVRR